MKLHPCLFAVLFMFASCHTSIRSSQHNSPTSEFQQLLDQTRQQYNMPAMAAAVVSDNQIIELAVSGCRSNNEPDKVQLDDLFQMGPATKLITSYWAALMVEAGQISWETTILDVFPHWKDNALRTYHTVTLADLLSHRGRLSPFTAAKDLSSVPTFDGNPSDKRKSFAKWLLGKNPVKPQNKWAYVYSNAGYAVAAVMLEKISNNSWEGAVLEDIAQSFSLDIQHGWPTQYKANQPKGHHSVHPLDSNLRAVTQANMFYVDDIVAPADNLSISIASFAQFIQLHLQGLRGQDNYLKAASYQAMHHMFERHSFGWSVIQQDSNSISSIDGSSGTFYTHASIYPDHNKAILIFVNASNIYATKSVYSLKKKLLQEYLSK